MLDRFTHTNSNGETLDFVPMGIFINYNQLRDFEWDVTTENNRIKGFQRPVTKKTIPFVFAVDEAQANEIKNKFFEHFEIDVLTQREGYFTINGYKYYCYITKSVKSDYLVSQRHLNINVEVTSDKSYWYKEKTTTVDFSQITGETNALTYAFVYPFVYSGSNSVRIFNEDFVDSGAIIRIYGEAVNPLVLINENVYQVNTTVNEGEYVEINTIEKTIYKYSNYGDKTNVFEARNKDYDIFLPVPSGSSNVSADGDYKVDIVMIEKRSEPKWS